jgi:predicted RNA-binding Zn-ribbon protein involved in translation (DUF1610 family)
MINQTKTTVIFACPQCNLAHEVTQTHSHTKKAGGFDCADCGAAVHFWYGCFDYSDWRPVNMNSMNFRHPVSADELRTQRFPRMAAPPMMNKTMAVNT